MNAAPWAGPVSNVPLLLALQSHAKDGHRRIEVRHIADGVPTGQLCTRLKRGQALQLTVSLSEVEGREIWQVGSETIDLPD